MFWKGCERGSSTTSLVHTRSTTMLGGPAVLYSFIIELGAWHIYLRQVHSMLMASSGSHQHRVNLPSCYVLSSGKYFAEDTNFFTTIAFGLRSRHALGGPKNSIKNRNTGHRKTSNRGSVTNRCKTASVFSQNSMFGLTDTIELVPFKICQLVKSITRTLRIYCPVVKHGELPVKRKF